MRKRVFGALAVLILAAAGLTRCISLSGQELQKGTSIRPGSGESSVSAATPPAVSPAAPSVPKRSSRFSSVAAEEAPLGPEVSASPAPVPAATAKSDLLSSLSSLGKSDRTAVNGSIISGGTGDGEPGTRVPGGYGPGSTARTQGSASAMEEEESIPEDDLIEGGQGRLSNRGLSPLGMCSPRFYCRGLIETFSDSEILRFGWLDNTFSDSCPCGEFLLADPRPKIVRIHIANGPCLRRERCGSYEIFQGETIESAEGKIRRRDQWFLDRFRARWEAVRQQISRAQNARILISNCLECDLSSEARGILLREAMRYFTGVEFVDNPMPGAGECLEGLICETHGMSQPGTGSYIVDLDGLDFFSVDREFFAKSHEPALMALAWTRSFNGLEDGPFIDPRQRMNFTGAREFSLMKEWLNAGEPVTEPDENL